jgi:hypothetical protein
MISIRPRRDVGSGAPGLSQLLCLPRLCAAPTEEDGMSDRVPVDGGELEYEVSGAGEPILLIHGSILADAFAPLRAQPALADHYRVIHYHRRGFASSCRHAGPC